MYYRNFYTEMFHDLGISVSLDGCIFISITTFRHQYIVVEHTVWLIDY